MLRKDYKLDLRHQVSFFKTARKKSTDAFTVYWKPTDTHIAFQVIVARGTVKTAVERNAIKRSVYDICAEILSQYKQSGCAIVIVVRRKNTQDWLENLKLTLVQILEN